jgi:hypothetical protein
MIMSYHMYLKKFRYGICFSPSQQHKQIASFLVRKSFVFGHFLSNYCVHNFKHITRQNCIEQFAKFRPTWEDKTKNIDLSKNRLLCN